ncbi:NAD(P)H-dependent oxidoreductase [Deminuibacter soli]|uniref:NADPH quinone reductase MdaB n=1 Tax=Deminuibacter soli TaxID=2291815 RepID=A0A3E1NF08_9BACT|nr:NAD(P)H-dependent oxidoreductase [Deminuibacter soli]RFM26391.1 NADPH quinone reductase MdaB [Deminuibacter soli]
MKKIFIINGGQSFGHSGGRFNATITEATTRFFEAQPDTAIRVTNINQPYDAATEVDNFSWADVIIYHIPVWWFQVPYKLKQYIDEVFSEGHAKGIYHSDGRSHANPAINYGTGGMLHGRQYMLTTSWNAPAEAFTLPGEFFKETNVDEGVMFGFHRMNAFTGMQQLPGIHFHDVEKNADVVKSVKEYNEHLNKVFASQAVLV